MADRYLLLLLLLLLSASLTLALARHISHTTTTTAQLHVSRSIAAASSAINFDPTNVQFNEMQSSATSSLSFHLHSRDFFPVTTPSTAHKDYRALTLARLHRDSARVRSITSRIDLAVHGIKHSDLMPTANQSYSNSLAAGGIQGPVVSGTSVGSGEYFSRVGIGSPPKPQFMVLDTGSDVTWVQCQPCNDCYQQSDPLFDPSASSSYSPVNCASDGPCGSLDVSSCRNNTCLYQVSYGDGSFTVGDFAKETLSFGTSPVEGVAIGCGHDNEGLFVGASGLLGLGGGSLSFPSQISARSFSYCLVDRDSTATSTLEIGSPDGKSDAAVAAPLLHNTKLETFYYIGLSGISVGGEVLSIPSSTFDMDESGSGGVIVDSGTAVTRLQSAAYTALRDAFKKGTKDLPTASGVALFDTCYDLSGRTSVEVPTVAFLFPGGAEMKMPAKNYLIPVDSAGMFCLAFAPTTGGLSIIGNVQQQGTRVSIDHDGAVVRFDINKC